MKSVAVAFSLFAICFFSCKPRDQKTKTVFVTDTTKVSDTVIFIRDSLAAGAFSDSLPSGFYHGMLPCDGCEGIQEIIAFDSAKTFRQEEMMWGKQTRPTKRRGNWERKDGQIWLYVNGKLSSKFRYSGNTLSMLERNDRKISSEDSGHYQLKKAQSASENPAWKKKGGEGVDFLGIGNEPFWSLEIDKEKYILFKLADWKKPVIAPIDAPKQFTDSTVYTVVAEGQPLRIAIYQEFGSDGMSDFLYEYKVEVRYNGKVFSGRGLYFGK